MGTGLSRPQEVRDTLAESWGGRKETSENHLCVPGTILVGGHLRWQR